LCFGCRDADRRAGFRFGVLVALFLLTRVSGFAFSDAVASEQDRFFFPLPHEEKSFDPWPAYRNDLRHTAVTSVTLSLPLERSWTFKSNPVSRPDESVFQVVSGEGLLFFGSPTEDSVYALDLETRQIRWIFSAKDRFDMRPL
jgi:outer membrane protein assembly factor BamB